MNRQSIRDFFHFSRSERNGIVVLCLLLTASAAWGVFWPGYISQRKVAEFEQRYAGFLDALAAEDPLSGARLHPQGETGTGSLNDQEADERGEQVPLVEVPAARELPSILNLNAVTARELIDIWGWTSETAYRTIRYREKLGGFCRPEQLREVFGLKAGQYEAVKERLRANPADVYRLNVNSSGPEDLMEHPYINKGLAHQIVNFREKVHPYSTVDDLLSLYFMNDSLLSLLQPYIEF